MQSTQNTSRIGLYFFLGIGLCLLAAGLKVLAAWAVETYLYALPVVGGLLTSLEIIEISNLLLFLLLGLGLGAATYYLPATWGLLPRLLLLVLALPLIFSVGYMTRYGLWLERVAQQSGLSRTEAQAMTDEFLERETGHSGNWGFYRYTARVTQPPVQPNRLDPASADEVERLQTELSRYSGLQSGIFAFLFKSAGWWIRLLYLLLAGFVGLVYFFKGQLWADRRRQRRAQAAKQAAAKAAPPSSNQDKPH
ncbi:MAG: hypothetical protein F6J97_09375 [Leptolyngbya sp. SIO4C1]|nr:hypothetical protein [Leptolyngbya sp. SIO4C1]